jgi:hypothetical protein
MTLTSRQYDVLRDMFDGVKPVFETPVKSRAYYKVSQDMRGYSPRAYLYNFAARGEPADIRITTAGLRLMSAKYPDVDKLQTAITAQEKFEAHWAAKMDAAKALADQERESREQERIAAKVVAFKEVLAKFNMDASAMSDDVIYDFGQQIAWADGR